jgi:hypothetical protein
MRSRGDSKPATAAEPAAKSGRGAHAAAGEAASGDGRNGRPPMVDVGPLGGMVGYALRRAQLAVFDQAIKGFAKLDLRPAQYSVLALIGYSPGLKQS